MKRSGQLSISESGTIQQQTAFSTPPTQASVPPAKPARTAAAPPRVTLSIEEAAQSLGISRDHLERHVLRELRIIYTGRRRLIPIGELHRWADLHAVAPIAARHVD